MPGDAVPLANDAGACGAGLEWHLDHTTLALAASAWQEALPDAFCVEVGRRMLLAELEFNEWMLRRVDRVRFDSDRSISWESSIDLNVRADAPVFVDTEGKRQWLVPLSMMSRQTSVSLDLRDEHDEPIMIPGLRLAQQLDQSILLAAAAAGSPSPVLTADSELRRYITRMIAGDYVEPESGVRMNLPMRSSIAFYLVERWLGDFPR